MRIEALIFDVDGTLAETEEAHRAAFNAVFAQWDLGWNWSRDAYAQLLKTTGGKERIKRFQSDLPEHERRLDDAEVAAFHIEKTKAYADILAKGELELRPGVADLMTRARDAGLRLAVATTTNTPNVEALCQCCWGKPALEVFEVVAAGDMVAAKKPAPDVFLLALEKLGLGADRAIAFEDSRNGLLSAQGAGLRTVVTPSAYTAGETFEGAHQVIASLEGWDWPR